MADITVRLLEEEDWPTYRSIRLAALTESPQAFDTTYAQEVSLQPEQWRQRLGQADRLLAERDGAPLAIVSVHIDQEDRQSAEVRDLWVAPTVRNTGIASRLVQSAADEATRHGCTRLHYWVGTTNGRAIGFAGNAGFRLTSRRRSTTLPTGSLGDQEIALVLSLASDPSAVPTSSNSRVLPRSGPR